MGSRSFGCSVIHVLDLIPRLCVQDPFKSPRTVQMAKGKWQSSNVRKLFLVRRPLLAPPGCRNLQRLSVLSKKTCCAFALCHLPFELQSMKLRPAPTRRASFAGYPCRPCHRGPRIVGAQERRWGERPQRQRRMPKCKRIASSTARRSAGESEPILF